MQELQIFPTGNKEGFLKGLEAWRLLCSSVLTCHTFKYVIKSMLCFQDTWFPCFSVSLSARSPTLELQVL